LNLVTYIKNSTNEGLLYTNCPAFVTGFKNAQLADEAAARTRKRICRDIYQRIQQVPRDVVGNNGPNNMDIDSEEQCCC
jgi:hypothetical protein